MVLNSSDGIYSVSSSVGNVIEAYGTDVVLGK